MHCQTETEIDTIMKLKRVAVGKSMIQLRESTKNAKVNGHATLFAGFFPYNSNPQTIKAYLKKKGWEPDKIVVPTDENNSFKRFAWITYLDEKTARSAWETAEKGEWSIMKVLKGQEKVFDIILLTEEQINERKRNSIRSATNPRDPP